MNSPKYGSWFDLCVSGEDFQSLRMLYKNLTVAIMRPTVSLCPIGCLGDTFLIELRNFYRKIWQTSPLLGPLVVTALS